MSWILSDVASIHDEVRGVEGMRMLMNLIVLDLSARHDEFREKEASKGK